MKKYTVKQFCDMTGVPFSTLRYYERIGLLNPYQDENNKYRGYTIKDAFKVNQFKRYRAFGFKVEEIKEFIECNEPFFLMEKIDNRQKTIDKEIVGLQQQYTMLEQLKGKISLALEEEYFKIVEKKDKLFLAASKKGIFNATKYDEFSQWVELLPLTNYSKMIDKQFFLEDDYNYNMDYGISIDKNKSSLLKEELLINARVVKLGKCVRFYTLMKNGRIAENHTFKDLKKFLEENNLVINGDFYLEGVPIKIKKYSKKGDIVWVPVKEK